MRLKEKSVKAREVTDSEGLWHTERIQVSECVISMQFIAMDLEHVMRVLCCLFLKILQKLQKKEVFKIKIQKETATIMAAA